jgi:hypothetical protein
MLSVVLAYLKRSRWLPLRLDNHFLESLEPGRQNEQNRVLVIDTIMGADVVDENIQKSVIML